MNFAVAQHLPPKQFAKCILSTKLRRTPLMKLSITDSIIKQATKALVGGR